MSDELVRLSKRMSELGLCSRREADEYIARGWVLVDGVRQQTLGVKVSPTAVITLDSRAVDQQSQLATIILNKPIGYVSGQPEKGYEPAVALLTAENRWAECAGPRFETRHLRGLAPAGRLDIDSKGMLVFTQDGRLARQLTGEDHLVEKEYLVRVAGRIPDDDIRRLRGGLELDGVPLLPAVVEWINADQLRFVLNEGRHRQIRRMCDLVGMKVIGLKRVRVGGVTLGKLPEGQWRYTTADDLFAPVGAGG